MRNIPINQHTLDLHGFRHETLHLVMDHKATLVTHEQAQFVYAPDGSILGGLVWTPGKVHKYGTVSTVDRPIGYLHS